MAERADTLLLIEDAQGTAERLVRLLETLRCVSELGEAAALGAMPARIVAQQIVCGAAETALQLIQELHPIQKQLGKIDA